jgi:hypothetical protein
LGPDWASALVADLVARVPGVHVTVCSRRNVQIKRRVSTIAATLAIAAGSLVATAGPAAALSCDRAQFITGSGGHLGASYRCYGSYFRTLIGCHRLDTGQNYQHWGNIAASGEVSTAWCALNSDRDWVHAKPV